LASAKHLCSSQTGTWELIQKSPDAQTHRVFSGIKCVDEAKAIFFVEAGVTVKERSGKTWQIPSDGFMVFPPGKDLNIFMYPESGGVSCYVNLSEPLTWDRATRAVSFVDLYLDIRLRANGSVELLDQHELQKAEEDGLLSAEKVKLLISSARELVAAASVQSYPFNLTELTTALTAPPDSIR
jgi:protein associated with RNAse G/E